MGYPNRFRSKKYMKPQYRAENFKLESPEKEREYKEDKEQVAFVTTLNDFHDKGLWKTVPDLEWIRFSGMPNFGYDSKNKIANVIKGKRNKDRGYYPGWYDITIFWKFAGKRYEAGLIEMKHEGGVVSSQQTKLRVEFTCAGVPNKIAFSAIEALRTMKGWGLIPPAYAVMI